MYNVVFLFAAASIEHPDGTREAASQATPTGRRRRHEDASGEAPDDGSHGG